MIFTVELQLSKPPSTESIWEKILNSEKLTGILYSTATLDMFQLNKYYYHILISIVHLRSTVFRVRETLAKIIFICIVLFTK